MCKYICKAMLLIVGFAIIGSASAAPLATYSFAVNTGASFVAAGVQSTSFGGGGLSNYYVGSDGFGNVLEAYSAPGAISAASALATNSYFDIILSATPGNSLHLDSLNFDAAKGGASDPRGYFVRSSVNGFSSDIFSTNLTSGANAAPAPVSIDLSSFGNLSSVEFRVFVWVPDFQLNSIDFRNLSLMGNVVAEAQDPPPLPEPMSLSLIFIGIAGIAAIRRIQGQFSVS